MNKQLLFDLRSSEKAEKYRSVEKSRVHDNAILLIFTSIVTIIVSVIWMIKPNRSILNNIFMILILLITLISLYWVLYLRPKAWYEKRITLPLINMECIFKVDTLENVIERYPFKYISGIYSNPSKHFISILLTEKSDKGFVIADIAKDQIIDIDLFLSVLKAHGVFIIEENISADIINHHILKFKEKNNQ